MIESRKYTLKVNSQYDLVLLIITVILTHNFNKQYIVTQSVMLDDDQVPKTQKTSW